MEISGAQDYPLEGSLCATLGPGFWGGGGGVGKCNPRYEVLFTLPIRFAACSILNSLLNKYKRRVIVQNTVTGVIEHKLGAEIPFTEVREPLSITVRFKAYRLFATLIGEDLLTTMAIHLLISRFPCFSPPFMSHHVHSRSRVLGGSKSGQ